MSANTEKLGWTLGKLLDLFIPAAMLENEEQHRRARMFMMSHAFGPILGSSLPIYMYLTDIARDYRVGIFLASVLAFWIYPFALRRGISYRLLAFTSIQNVAFCVIWACYSFGGLLSPFVAWMLIIPLLSFLYLPPVGKTKWLLLGQIYVNLTAFIWMAMNSASLPSIQMADLQIIGVISMVAVAVYFSMMALYFATMLREQREFERKLHDLVASSDNIRNLTNAARQASAAKAGFIAGMSHELRTPLNAIIGYSQLLLEEAEDDNDDESVTDLGQIHKSGSDLLYLIDHVLDYSRIEAGKMPSNPTPGRLDQIVQRICSQADVNGMRVDVRLLTEGHETRSMVLDWDAIGAILRNLAAAAAAKDAGSCISAGILGVDDGCLLIVEQTDSTGNAVPIELSDDMFRDAADQSASKYGGMGIELALAQKYIEMIGAQHHQIVRSDGTCLTEIRLPCESISQNCAIAA